MPKSSSRRCHERMVVMSLVVVLAVLSQESSAQSGKPRATVSMQQGDTKGDLLSTTVIAVAAGVIVVLVLCVLVFFIAITTAIVVKRRGSYSLPTENEYAAEQQQQPIHANITPPLPPRTAEMFQMIEHYHSPSLSSRKSQSPPLPQRTAEMFELIDNFSPPSSDISSVDDENEIVSNNDSQNQDENLNTAVGVSVSQNEVCSAPPIPPRPRPSSSNDHSYYNMSAVIAAVNPMLLGETPIPPRPSRSTTPPPPLPPKPVKQSHSRFRQSLPSKSNILAVPVNPQTKIEVNVDELPESERQTLSRHMAAGEKLNKCEPPDCGIVVTSSKGNEINVQSCDVGMTSEESLDMWPPVVPRQTEDVFFVADKDARQSELMSSEELNNDGINLMDNVAYKVVS